MLAAVDQFAFCGKLGCGSAANSVGDDADRMAWREVGFPAGSKEGESKERKEGSDPFYHSSFSSIGLYQTAAISDWLEASGSVGNEGDFNSSKTGEMAFDDSLYSLRLDQFGKIHWPSSCLKRHHTCDTEETPLCYFWMESAAFS